MYRPVLILAALGLGAVSMHAFAASLPESMAPLPYVKPENPVAITMPAAMPAPVATPVPDVTGTIPRTDPLVVAPQLKAGLDALAGNDIAAALATRNGLAEGSLDRHILTWAIATSGAPGVPSGEIAAAQTELKGWPG
ncbi:lytic transglycosylase domain-containing protein, partial [Neorhizobium sp. BETTINA12A]|nr:lytic transglycosylase domain-containing protein [Neorhizobium sp. BETTINA12A]